MPEPLFEFDTELGRWKPTKRGRREVNRRRVGPDGRVRFIGGNREFTDRNRRPTARQFAVQGGNLEDAGGGGFGPGIPNRVARRGQANRPVRANAPRARARRDLGQNAASRGAGNAGQAAAPRAGVPSTRPSGGGGQARGGGAVDRVARGLRDVADRARNRAADFLEGAANRRRRRR